MSYGIVRVQKMTKGALQGMQIHNQREKDHSHTNADIDFLKSNQNYDLKNNQDINYHQKIKEIISQSYTGTRAIRKDAILMCECLITSDNDFFKTLTPEQQQQFFKQSYEWLCERFGKKNIVAATVHLDERTPHMHFDFVPMTADGKLSAKEIFRYKTDLSKLHDNFYKHIGQKYGLERGEHKEGQQHLSVIEYKEQTSKEVKQLESKVRQLQQEQSKIDKLQENISELKKKNKILDEQISIAESHENAVQATRECVVGNYAPNIKKSLMGQISMSESEYKRIMSVAKKSISLDSQNKRLKAENESLKNSVAMKEIEKLTKLLLTKNSEESIKNILLQTKGKELDEINQVLEKHPQLKDEVSKAIQQNKTIQHILDEVDNKNRGFSR